MNEKLLKCLGKARLTAAELAKQMRVPKLQVYRHLAGLVDEGIVYICGTAPKEKRRGPRSRLYKVSP